MQNTDTVREKLFTMRMSAEEWARAEKLAAYRGLTVAALVRMLLKDAERANEREMAASSPKPRGRK